MKSVIAWFIENHVAANLLMLFIILVGCVTFFNIKVEVLPETSLDQAVIMVKYPGSPPSEIEESIVAKIEKRISAVSCVKEIRSNIREGYGRINAEIIEGCDVNVILDDIKARVDAIDSFPKDMEKPIVRRAILRSQVLSVAVHGDVSESVLKRVSEEIKDDIINLPGITMAELDFVRPEEIHIEVSEKILRKYSLTLGEVADVVRKEALNLPAGKIQADSLEVWLRIKGARYKASEYLDIGLISQYDGGRVNLGDAASIKNGFEDTGYSLRFDGKPASMIKVFRIGDQDALSISEKVQKYVRAKKASLPEGIDVAIFGDITPKLKNRIDILLNNLLMGLILVVAILGIFLDLRLSFWVTMGIPIAFIFGLAALPQFGISINMISLFAFILVLGIVVDDAIIIGENIFKKKEQGMKSVKAAVEGSLEVGAPVTFSVLTTIIAFCPLLLVGGYMGKMMKGLPIAVIMILIGSLLESLLILPSHLSGSRYSASSLKKNKLASHGFDNFINNTYLKFLTSSLNWRYSVIAFCIFLLLLSFGLWASGMLKFTFFRKLDGNIIHCYVTMPAGVASEKTSKTLRRLEKNVMEVLGELESGRSADSPKLLRHIISFTGRHLGKLSKSGEDGEHLGQIWLQLLESGKRGITTEEIIRALRQKTGYIQGVESITFGTDQQGGGGAPIHINLSLDDPKKLLLATKELKTKIAAYNGIFDIEDSFNGVKKEVKIKLRPEASSLGVSLNDLSFQVRNAFWGVEALNFQNGKNEVKVIVRYPESERKSIRNIETMRILTSDKNEVAFNSIAEFSLENASLNILRAKGQRVAQVKADVDSQSGNANEIRNDLLKNYLPKLEKRFSGLSYYFEGEGKSQNQSLRDLKIGFFMAFFAIYSLIAIFFKSFLQPLLVMSAIPFAFIGAVAGHLLLGYDLSFLSVLGMVGLTGIVVNDSLVLIDVINKNLIENGLQIREAIQKGVSQRFRAVFLTSITTFAGLAPIIFERNVQTQSLIPMAITMAFGVLFATCVTLVFVPCLYMIFDDIHRLVSCE